MNNIEAAKQTLRIISQRRYTVGEKQVELPALEYESVEVISPEDGKRLVEKKHCAALPKGKQNITVTAEDSFQAARRYDCPLVMNFANAHVAGGGFKLGANAQEEALCRCSTLYVSISSKKASEMYRYNNTHISPVESDYMLLSKEVCVFRNERLELLETPFRAAVVTVPAPDRHGAALIASKRLIEETMTRRIRILLNAAAKHGFKALVLGAWGCGAFGNSPIDVSGHFRKVLIDEGCGSCFDEICFAIYGRPDGKNITAFKKTFS